MIILYTILTIFIIIIIKDKVDSFYKSNVKISKIHFEKSKNKTVIVSNYYFRVGVSSTKDYNYIGYWFLKGDKLQYSVEGIPIYDFEKIPFLCKENIFNQIESAFISVDYKEWSPTKIDRNKSINGIIFEKSRGMNKTYLKKNYNYGAENVDEVMYLVKNAIKIAEIELNKRCDLDVKFNFYFVRANGTILNV